MLDFRIYCVYDKERKEYWQTGKGKRSWSTKAAAKNAWNNDRPSEEEFPEGYRPGSSSDWVRAKVFNDQKRYVVHELTPKEVDIKVVT